MIIPHEDIWWESYTLIKSRKKRAKALQSISESFIPLPVSITRLEMITSIQILSFLAKKFNDNVTIFCCDSPEKKN